MADISTYLAAIMSAIYGEDVRGSIHDAIEIINDVSEVVLSTGTAVDSASSSSTGFYTGSLYLNTDTFELWKCIGTDTWQSQGTLKGENGNGIASIEKTGTAGLVDTYTITYDDGDTDTFTVTNGEDGVDGNKWYRGTGISGKAVNPTVYSSSGVTDANPNDFYLNPNEGAVYHCVTGGDASTATWAYDFTMTGGGGGGTSDYTDLTNKPQINSHTLSGNQTSSQLGLMGTGSVSWNQIQTSTGGTKIAEVTIEGTPTDVYAPTGGGGGASSLNDLTDVTITSPSSDQVLKYDGTKWVNDSPNNGTFNVQQNGTTKGSSTANQSGTTTANIETDEWYGTTATVSSGTFSFSGLDDTKGWGFKPFVQITGNSTNKNPTAQISSISGAGTASMSVTYTTDADNGATVKLRIIK